MVWLGRDHRDPLVLTPWIRNMSLWYPEECGSYTHRHSLSGISVSDFCEKTFKSNKKRNEPTIPCIQVVFYKRILQKMSDLSKSWAKILISKFIAPTLGKKCFQQKSQIFSLSKPRFFNWKFSFKKVSILFGLYLCHCHNYLYK